MSQSPNWRRCQESGLEDVAYRLDWEAAYPEPHTPDEQNRIGIRRYCHGRGGEPAAVLILMPGFTGGVNDFHHFAPSVVTACRGRVEAWALDRRNNTLEDLAGMAAAEEAADPRLALAHYFGERGQFHPRAPASMAFMQHWGLATAVADLRVVVERARRRLGPHGRVFLGGHSLGGMLAQCYAAWDFDGEPGAAGVDGLVLIDGAVGGDAWTATTGLAQYDEARQAITSGAYYWEVPARGAAPQVGALAQIAAMAATLPEWRERPALVAPFLAGLLQVPEDVALTNEALLGLAVDSESGPFASYRASVGQLNPTPIGEHDGRPLLGWIGHRAAGKSTDLQLLAGALRLIEGANGMEWYGSRRLNGEVDLSSNLDSRSPVTGDLAEAEGLRLWHHRTMDRPVFAAVTRSPEQALWRYTWYRDNIAATEFELLSVPEYEHLDPLFADHSRGQNRCLAALAPWLLRQIERVG